MDWASWLRQASSRNEAFRDEHGLAGNGFPETALPEDVPPPPQPVGVPRDRRRGKRLRKTETDDTEIVISEPLDPEASSARGSAEPEVEFLGE